MRKGKDMLGKPIVALSTGERVASVQDLVFDHEAARLLALLVDEGGWFRAARVVPLLAVRSFGDDAVVIGAPEDVVNANTLERVPEILHDKATLTGTTLMTTDGKNLGRLADLYFDERTGDVLGYDVTGGIFSDLSSGRSFVPAEGRLSLGQDVAFVPPETAALMEEQEPGGLRGALNTAGQNIQETYGNVAEATRQRQKAFVVGRTAARDVTDQSGVLIVRAGEVITPAQAEQAEAGGALGTLFASAGGGALQEGLGAARERVQEGYGNLSTASRERQRAFVLGKTAGQDVTAPDGTLIVTGGDTIMEEMVENAERHGALPQLVAAAGGGLLQEQVAGLRERVLSTGEVLSPAGREQQRAALIGKTTAREVIAPDGTLIVAGGAAITALDIEQAEAHGALGLLARSAGGTLVETDGSLGTPVQTSVQLAPTQGVAVGTASVQPAYGQAAADDVQGTLGRRVARDVYGTAGSLIAAQGQIVTQAVIERARIQGREAELLAATSRAAVAGAAAGVAGERLREGAQNVREGAATLLDRAREWVNDTRERAEEEAEERRIRGALGRPVTRVVLDPQDNVILNVGEIITHKAIEEARSGGVLSILLDSVSTEVPHINPEDVRPNVRGDAALPSDTAGTQTSGAQRSEDAGLQPGPDGRL